ncbi:hypothetical protein SAMN04487950_1883 [Halogranum rubrum]|uniref:Metal-binding protein n=1 Tax=Halogranum rubrum TaxID=553466 RepID=A0A1I4E6A6_9EURY|nr:DUF2103 domain-containing protein [Halogranum rubrum]SFL00470.1 hypothetical protein SAMN04487950_1883 [Halogranum rubrum]
MNCRRCESPLQKPGDYCLTCNTANCDAVVVEFRRDRATLTMLDEDEIVGETIVTTLPEPDEERGGVELRNFAGRVADEIQRKRPETVYAAARRDESGGTQGTPYDARDALRETKAQVHYEFYRVTGDDIVQSVLDRRGERSLEVVETPPREKIGGTHSTLIGGRKGRKAIALVADHPHVKKIIPGPIDAGGTGSRTSLRAKVTRADDNGNVRLLLRDGSSVQENRIVTTAMDRETGEWVRDDLNEALREAELQES